MKPKLKRKKYYTAGSIWDTASTPSNVLASVPQTDNIKMDPNQITTDAQSTVGPLSGIQSQGVGSAAPTTTSNSWVTPALGAIGGMATAPKGDTAFDSLINTGKSGLYRAADTAMPGAGVAMQFADTGINMATQQAAKQFRPESTAGIIAQGAADWSKYGPDPGTKLMLGQIGAAKTALFDVKKEKARLQAEEDRLKNQRLDELAYAQQYTDQTTGTQQTNPVYGMEEGGSIYDLGHMKHGGHMRKKHHKKHLSNHESGIVNSSHNGVDKTKASMPEGAFVIPANKREQAIKDGILEDKPMSPNQGGVPIMISGGDVNNPEREGVIMPGKVKQLLAMGVDLDKYAPNADHSLYDIAGTRKNVEHGGLMHYAGGNTVLKNKIKYDPNQYINNIDTEAGKDYQLNVIKDLQEEPQNEYQWSVPGLHNYYEKSLNPTASQQPVWDPVAKHYFMENTTDQNLANLASKYPSDPSFNLDAWSAAGGLNAEPRKTIDPFTVEKKNTQESTPWTEEQKALGIEAGLAGLNLGVQGAEALWNLSREYTPLPKPTRFISETYTPDVSAMDAFQKQQMDIARSTGMYNARQAGMTPNLLTAMHANELAGMNQYNAQRQGMLENARLQNLQQANQDRADFARQMYGRDMANYEKLQEFKGGKAAALGENVTEAMKALSQGAKAGKEYLYDTADTRYQQHQNANSLAYQLNAKTIDQADYRKNKDTYDQALKTLSSLKAKNPTKYSELAPAIATMSWPDAVNYLSTRI